MMLELLATRRSCDTPLRLVVNLASISDFVDPERQRERVRDRKSFGVSDGLDLDGSRR